ncbi:lysophospholipid acyltransferase family protein, partial [Flavobacterium sp.]|uniref:lysophospholipid acyltransferase family protein n=1 Tax=Flavobacterium sp. TaxID=239 RepID=UPI00342E6F03
IIIYPFFYLISLLPFRVLYFLSDGLYILLYRIIGYRKKTVRENLWLALPHLSVKERRIIERKFYHHFCDTLVEMVKTITVPVKEIQKRFVIENPEAIKETEERGKGIAFLCGHFCSYEWMLVMNKQLTTHKGFGIYKTIRNKYFDKLVRKLRSRFDGELIDTRRIIPAMRDHKRKGILGFYGFLSDQSPKLSSTIYWGNFFDMEVPVHVGAEILAKKLDLNIMLVKSTKTGRGRYNARFIPFEGNPKDIPNYEISDMFLKMLENDIRETPEFYLWTHKRFKHRKNDPPATKGTTL